MFRRKTASLLVIALLISLLAPAGGSDGNQAYAASGKYLHLNFDEYPVEASLSNPTSTADGGGSWSFFGTVANSVYGIGESFPDREGRSMSIVSQVLPDHSTANPNIQKNNMTIPGAGATDAIVVMEGSFRFDNTLLERRLFSAAVTALPSTTTLGEIRLTMGANGQMTLLYPSEGGGNSSHQLGTYEGDVWYHIQLYVDLGSRQLQAYVNGELRATLAMSGGWDNLRSFRFVQIGSADTSGTMTMDDIMVRDWIPVESLTLNRSVAKMAPGDMLELSAELLPLDRTNPYLIWESDQPDVATVDERGSVTAVANGTATITARSKENEAISASAEVTVEAYQAVESVQLTPSSLEVEKDRSAELSALVSPSGATNSELSWSSNNPVIATVDSSGVVSGIAEGSALITATSQDGPLAQSSVTVVPRNTPVETIMIPSTAKVEAGDTISVTPRFLPVDATNPSFRWTSGDESIAIVDSDGRIEGREPGVALITVASADEAQPASAMIEVEVTEPAESLDAFDQLRLKWKETLDGGPELDASDAAIAEKLVGINELAFSRWETMLLDEERETLWEDITPSTTDSAYFNSYLTRLRDMAYAYSTKGGVLYHNVTLEQDILSALDWIYEHAYNEQIEEYGNWWNFDIGAPLRLMSILVMLYDDASSDQIEGFVRTADKFIGDIRSESFTQVGANRSDIMTIEALMGILTKDSERLNDVLVQIEPLFDYVSEGDGFYEDGSFIQHSSIAYTGSYGEVLVRGVGQLLYLLGGSPWEVTDPDAAHVYRWIFESVAPLVYQGEMMDMVRGRAIAREEQNGYIAAIGMLSGMLRLAMSAPEETAVQMKGLIKSWVQAADSELDVYELLSLDLIAPLKTIMEDEAISPLESEAFHKEFGAMNRTVHIGDDFAFGISKSSERISTYELTNGENGKGWYTGDGMTYLYNGDRKQYTEDFWATVNMYKLPGTTVDTRTRASDQYQYGDGETTPDNKWAGGTTLGTNGVSGMNLQQTGTSLVANKSWFMFGDVIVALGSGITSNDDRTIETIVE